MAFSKEEMSACLRELRARKRVTQQEVADAVGVDATSIYNYENGRTAPTQAFLSALFVLPFSLDTRLP